jgi:putative methionine-R-sulfoxide reductase with GAF domain
MQSALEAIVERFAADTATIHLIEDGVLVLKAEVGVPPPVRAVVARVPIGKGMAGEAAELNRPVSSCNLKTDGQVPAGARKTGVGGAIVVPIRDAAGRCRGTLGIGVKREHVYSDEEIARLLGEAALLG